MAKAKNFVWCKRVRSCRKLSSNKNSQLCRDRSVLILRKCAIWKNTYFNLRAYCELTSCEVMRNFQISMQSLRGFFSVMSLEMLMFKCEGCCNRGNLTGPALRFYRYFLHTFDCQPSLLWLTGAECCRMAVGVFRVFLVLAFACLLGFSHLARFVNGQHGSGHSRLSFVYTREYLPSLCDFASS